MGFLLQKSNMQNNQVPLYSAYQPSLSYRLRHSKALLAILAVLGVTVVALAAALVLNRSDAQPGVSSASAPAAVTSPTPTSQLAATTATPAQTPAQTLSQQSTAPVVVAKAAVCADCGTVKSVTAVERQGQVNGMSVGNTTIGLGAVAGGVLFHF
jgi:outer membrane lipoprotein SlyB